MRLRKLFRPLLLTMLAAAMLCSLALPASASVLQTGSRPFNDVVRNSWYYNYVYSAYDQGVFAGLDKNTFGTRTSMTRGMMVTVLYGMAGKPSTKTSRKLPCPLRTWSPPGITPDPLHGPMKRVSSRACLRLRSHRI